MECKSKHNINNDIGYIIREISLAFKKHMDFATGHSSDGKVTPLHAWFIKYIVDREQDGLVTYQKDVEQEFSIRRSTATEVIKLIENNGLIVRESVASDARLKRIIPTERAIAMHEMVKEAHIKMEETMREGISEEELATFFAVIKKIKINLENI